MVDRVVDDTTVVKRVDCGIRVCLVGTLVTLAVVMLDGLVKARHGSRVPVLKGGNVDHVHVPTDFCSCIHPDTAWSMTLDCIGR